MANMALDPDAPESMRYGPMLIGISYDGDRITGSSSACPCAVTVLNTNYGGLDAAMTIMYMNNLEVFGSNRNTEQFRLARHHLYQVHLLTSHILPDAYSCDNYLRVLPVGFTWCIFM